MGQRAKVGYDFDAIGRVTVQREYDAQAAPTKTTNFTYDAAGNLLTWNDGTYSATRSYDDVERLSSETVNYGSFNLHMPIPTTATTRSRRTPVRTARPSSTATTLRACWRV